MTVLVITQTYKFKDMPKSVPALNHEEQAYFIILSPIPFTEGLKDCKETEECKIMSKRTLLKVMTAQ
jgi:hypothetical protein